MSTSDSELSATLQAAVSDTEHPPAGQAGAAETSGTRLLRHGQGQALAAGVFEKRDRPTIPRNEGQAFRTSGARSAIEARHQASGTSCRPVRHATTWHRVGTG